MLTAIFRVMFSFAVRNDFLLGFFLILNEFNICDLLFGRRWHQEEKSQNEGCHHR
jgi:hypothetical protein